LARLLRMPDRRTTRGKRDLALLHLLGSVGLRRAEAADLLMSDVDERRRSPAPGRSRGRRAGGLTVRYGKRRGAARAAAREAKNCLPPVMCSHDDARIPLASAGGVAVGGKRLGANRV
jgi:integrase